MSQETEVILYFLKENDEYEHTVKLVYNNHPWDQKKWSLLTGGRCTEVINAIKGRIGTLK